LAGEAVAAAIAAAVIVSGATAEPPATAQPLEPVQGVNYIAYSPLG
jgi:hypothetical protein